MTDRTCPLNKRPCRCDPNATDKKFHPCQLTKRIGKLIRMFGSTFEGETIAATTQLKRLVQAEELSFNDLAVLIENCDGQIEERKYSDTDAEVIFARGQEKGRVEQARERDAPPEFYDADGEPRWLEIALFCQKHLEQLGAREQEFINSVASQLLWRPPSEKQEKWLLSIFVRLGGTYDPKAMHLRR